MRKSRVAKSKTALDYFLVFFDEQCLMFTICFVVKLCFVASGRELHLNCFTIFSLFPRSMKELLSHLPPPVSDFLHL